MKKQFLTMMLIFSYLLVSMWSLKTHIHYCCGNLAFLKIEIASKKSENSHKSNGCCTDKISVLKIDESKKHQVDVAFNAGFLAFIPENIFSTLDFKFGKIISFFSEKVGISSSPPIKCLPIYILHQVFRL